MVEWYWNYWESPEALRVLYGCLAGAYYSPPKTPRVISLQFLKNQEPKTLPKNRKTSNKAKKLEKPVYLLLDRACCTPLCLPHFGTHVGPN